MPRWPPRESDVLNLDRLDLDEPFEIDDQLPHLVRHGYEVADIDEAWDGEPVFYRAAQGPAHWLMFAEVSGEVLIVPLAPSRSGDWRRCRPIGCYRAGDTQAARYRQDRSHLYRKRRRS